MEGCCCCARSRRAIFSISPRTPCCLSLPPPLPPNAAAADAVMFGECTDEVDATATGRAGDDGMLVFDAAGSDVVRPCSVCAGVEVGACLAVLINDDGKKQSIRESQRWYCGCCVYASICVRD